MAMPRDSSTRGLRLCVVAVMAATALFIPRVNAEDDSVVRDGRSVSLTTLEFDLLYFLAARPGRVFSREALMEQVWGSDRVVDERSIDSLVSRLRRKLDGDTPAPRYLQTVWGAGYRLVVPA